MLKIAIIVFRECIEVTILLAIIMAATRHIKNSKSLVLLGCAIGSAFAGIFAFSTSAIVGAFDGIGDEIFDVGVIMLACFSIMWTVVWMQGYSAKIKHNLNQISYKIENRESGAYMLVLLVSSAILRETTEIILFIYSLASTNNISSIDYIFGFVIGGVGGILVGSALYLGLLKLAGKYIFKISSFLLILIAAGLSAKAAGILTSTGLISLFSDILWDSSWLLNDQSIGGKIFANIIGYESKPNGMQFIFYIFTILITYLMLKIKQLKKTK